MKGGKSLSVLRKVVADGSWVAAAKITSQVSQIGTFFLAARILMPSEFGFYAFLSALMVLLVVLAEGGWAEFIMKSGYDRDRFEQLVSISLVSGVLVTSVGLGGAFVLYTAFAQQAEGVLVAIFSCWILPAAITTVYDGTLVACGRLRAQAVVRIVSEVVGFSVTATGLFMGGHAIALVVGRIVSQLVILVGSVCFVRQKPRLHLTRAMVAEVAAFSKYIVATRLIIFLGSYSGTLAVGGFLGVTEAGYYRAAERIVAAISELMGEPIRALAWVEFRRARDLGELNGTNVLADAARQFLVWLFVVASPVYLGLMLVSPELIHIVLGEKWMPSAIIVSILCVKLLLLSPGYISEPLLTLSGNIHRRMAVTMVNAAVSVLFIIIFAPMGLLALAASQCVSASFSLTTSARIQIRYVGVNWRKVITDSIHMIGPSIGLMMAAVLSLQYAVEFAAMPTILALFLKIAVGTVAYVSLFLIVRFWMRRFPTPA
ncbi:oligosaccharide flippase family protein [Rhizobium hainanense]|uniref:Membrane protein involved in the export of O-antigen and teichoic acid n=1 Tax=Rhizobium hainanense TaxID=52131 RepID=A0A1C3VWV3_9HYPH|nr:oligosaccharide flippase family protein [Rhizobium hainanense]SCB32105.1 Membrane protein involved in the export of O-antigen and teichoic acid [Rhizobium hainanense]